MEYRFDPSQVRHIRINGGYDLGTAAAGEMKIVILTPRGNWTIQGRWWSKTIRVTRWRIRGRRSTGIKQVARAWGGGNMTFIVERDSVAADDVKVQILTPAGITAPKVTSL